MELSNVCDCEEGICDGYCWESKQEMFAEDIKELMDNNPSGMWDVSGIPLWNRTTGGTFHAKNISEIIRGMTVNTEWHIKYTVFDDLVVYSLSHHDAPTGSVSVLKPMTE